MAYHPSKTSAKTLTYVIPRNWGDPSFDPLDSDSVANAAHMEQLVGTLVKMGASGKYEPYLAESWDQSEDALFWRFRLRENLSCSDGSPIDAPSFVTSFQTTLALYAASTEVPVFSQLRGWDAFLKGDLEALGIRAIGEKEIIFEFARKPQAGLLQYLSMPYYGFYCTGNFQDGKWKDRDSIISSGAYVLEKVEEDKTIVLRKRQSDRIRKDAPEIVKIRRLEKAEALALKSEKTIVHTILTGEEEIPDHWMRLTGVPINLIGIAFGRQEAGPFKEVHARRYILQRLRDLLPKDPVGSYSPARSFYFDALAKPEAAGRRIETPKVSFDGVVKILSGAKHGRGKVVGLIEEMLGSVLSDLGLKYEFFGLDPNDPNFVKRYTSNDEWHIRLFNVSTGSSPKNWVVRMMFCSSLGINFTDPSGRICELVDRFDRAPFDYVDYVKEFEAIIEEDAAVIPLFHMRQTWLYTDDLDLSRVSLTIDIPPFENVGVRE